ncbi:MAG: class II aldolase/adducin family protein [Oscillospiraceae bacterium]|nr:class II aldolase/adducin family protein [Oscillospiraceae bacterium]
MAYEINEAKVLVVEAGKKLVEKGLIARTWGNVSARISDTQFVITPSGKPYETLTPEEIVVVNIDDCEYEGDIKPSSEKGIHADAYRLRPEVNFVIHTHQIYASALSTSGRGIPEVPYRMLTTLGPVVPVAEYGMPSTDTLRKGVEAAYINYPKSRAIIMKHHGAICLGKDMAEAFKVAEVLEDTCKKEVGKICMEVSGMSRIGANMLASIFEDYALGANKKKFDFVDLCSSKREGDEFILTTADGNTFVCDLETGVAKEGIAPRASLIHSEIYKSSKVNYISHFADKHAIALSKLGIDIKPHLDDFAQIAGHNVKNAEWNKTSYRTDAPKIAKALKNRNAVLIKGMGALCTGTSEFDCEAVKLVLEKECITELASRLAHTNHAVDPMDALIMRVIYVLKYSKKASE